MRFFLIDEDLMRQGYMNERSLTGINCLYDIKWFG
jgi:hypothetical protein